MDLSAIREAVERAQQELNARNYISAASEAERAIGMIERLPDVDSAEVQGLLESANQIGMQAFGL